MLKTKKYLNIDDILGDPKKRYFSCGFKNVEYSFKNTKINSYNKSIEANGIVLYPQNWSVKNEGISLKPHLSTIDAFLLSFYLNVFFLNKIYGLDNVQRMYTWVRKLVIKSGSQPVYNLDCAEINSRLVSTEPDPCSLCGNISKFITTIGGFKIELTFDHFIGKPCFINESYEDECEVFENLKRTYYSHWYRQSIHNMTDIDIDIENKALSSRIHIENSKITELGSDISSYCYSFYTIVDIFACASQQMQALVYHMDDVDRRYSNNLWMRKIELEYKFPISKQEGFKQSVQISNTQTIDMKDSKWRTADVRCIVDLPVNPMTLNVNIAHKLPAC